MLMIIAVNGSREDNNHIGLRRSPRRAMRNPVPALIHMEEEEIPVPDDDEWAFN